MALFEFHITDPRVLELLAKLEAHLSKQDDAIQAFSDKVTAQLTTISNALDNIALDEAGLAKQIEDLKASSTELTAENQAKLDAILQSATAMATRTQSIADAVPDSVTP